MTVFIKLFAITSLLFLTANCDFKKTTTLPQKNIPVAEKSSIVQRLKEDESLSIEEQIALYRELKEQDQQSYNFENENELTMYGYSFLWENKFKEAIAIFQLIVSEFNSSNAYDSLGEAYLKAGHRELALWNYKKALKMNPDNFNAEDQIELLEHPDKKPEKPSDKFYKVYPIEAYQNDLQQLGEKLIEVHPNALKFISKEAFWNLIHTKKKQLTAFTTYAEFVWHCNEIIASINCSHTSLDRFFQESEMLPVSLRFPLQVRWVKEQLFVIDPLDNSEQINLKDEIVSINGVPVTVLMDECYKHIASQGFIETTKRHFFNTWATAMIPYALGFPEKYSIHIKGVKNPIVLQKATSFRDLFRDPSIETCEKELCLEILDAQTAVLTIASFNYYPWNNLSVFTDFIDQSMREINEKGIQNLIIDVRFNGGGSQEAALHLLRYLTDKPFRYYSKVAYEGKIEKINGEEKIAPFNNQFKGKQYFLIDGEGNSTTGHFMSLVKVWNLGFIIGEELGSNQFCSAGQTVCRLSNTKLTYYVANNTHVSTATSLPDEVGILPDYEVLQNINDFLNKNDVVKAFTLSLIAKNNASKTVAY